MRLGNSAGSNVVSLDEMWSRTPDWAKRFDEQIVVANWFHDARLTQDAFRNVVVNLRHPAHIEWVRTRYGSLIADEAKRIFPDMVGLRYSAPGDGA